MDFDEFKGQTERSFEGLAMYLSRLVKTVERNFGYQNQVNEYLAKEMVPSGYLKQTFDIFAHIFSDKLIKYTSHDLSELDLDEALHKMCDKFDALLDKITAIQTDTKHCLADVSKQQTIFLQLKSTLTNDVAK